MNTYQIIFMGRKIDAIGIRYRMNETVKADTLDQAIFKLYDKYQDIGIVSAIYKEDNIQLPNAFMEQH